MIRRRNLRALFALLALVLVAGACAESATTVVSGARLEDDTVPAAEAVDAPEAESSAPEPGEDGAGVGEISVEPAETTEDPIEFKLGPLPGSEDDEGAVDDRSESGDPTSVAGASFLTRAADVTEAAPSYRYELFLEMFVEQDGFELDFSPAAPLAWGAVSGTSQSMSMDLGTMFDELFASLGGTDADDLVRDMFGDDLSMDSIVMGTTMYIRAPFLAGMASGPAGSQLPPGFGELVDLADGWGTVDLNRLGSFTAGDMTALAGMQGGGSATEMLAILRDAGAVVTDLGPVTVRGVETTRYQSDLNFSEMMEAQGIDPAALGVSVRDLAAVSLPFDVYIDDENQVRRLTLTISIDQLQAMAPDEDFTTVGGDFRMTSTVDLFDFGADVQITPPPASDIVGDFTDLFFSLN